MKTALLKAAFFTPLSGGRWLAFEDGCVILHSPDGAGAELFPVTLTKV